MKFIWGDDAISMMTELEDDEQTEDREEGEPNQDSKPLGREGI